MRSGYSTVAFISVALVALWTASCMSDPGILSDKEMQSIRGAQSGGSWCAVDSRCDGNEVLCNYQDPCTTDDDCTDAIEPKYPEFCSSEFGGLYCSDPNAQQVSASCVHYQDCICVYNLIKMKNECEPSILEGGYHTDCVSIVASDCYYEACPN